MKIRSLTLDDLELLYTSNFFGISRYFADLAAKQMQLCGMLAFIVSYKFMETLKAKIQHRLMRLTVSGKRELYDISLTILMIL